MSAEPGRVVIGEPLPLVETKLLPPRSRPQLVQRTRLYDALDRLHGTELTLVSGPAGGGKSVLVGSWCEARRETALAWVSLDPADDDPVRLWTYVATAVDRVRPGIGRPALGRLRSPTAGVMTAVDELVNGIAAYREPLTIVLDDLHLIREESTLRAVEYVVERLPPGARVVATTRVDPPIRVGRLRAKGALGELRAKDLAFTLDEARELLVGQEGIRLADEDLALLVERSEGWATGLYLAALWLRDHPDPAAGVRDFTGDHRHVADFLSGEVIEALDPETRTFLVRTSVLNRLSGPLCDHVMASTGGRDLLARLARSNLFLVPLDGRGEWYRYHHLFGELLRIDLRRADPGLVAESQRRAAAWCLAEGLLEEALEYAGAAADDSLVAEILLEHHRSLLRSGREATLLRWVGRLGSSMLLEHPELPAAGALASGLLARPASERARLLEVAERSSRERPERWSAYVASGVSLARGVWIDGNTGRAVLHGRAAAELGRQGADEIAVAALASLSYALYIAGELDESRSVAEEAVRRPDAGERPHGVVLAHSTLALLDLDESHHSAAEANVRLALDTAAAAGLGSTWSAGLAHTTLGAVLAARTDLARGEREAVRGEALRRAPEPTVEHAHAVVVLAGIRVARRRLAAAARDLRLVRESLQAFADPGRLPELADRVELALAAAKNGASPSAEQPSASELAVLRLLATDLTQREIGRRLFLSLNTVKTHTRGLYRKLGATSRDEAVDRAAGLGLLDGTDRPDAGSGGSPSPR
jgi:LuxR family transcriptional regulator, maltose regulon positive regulatory protein